VVKFDPVHGSLAATKYYIQYILFTTEHSTSWRPIYKPTFSPTSQTFLSSEHEQRATAPERAEGNRAARASKHQQWVLGTCGCWGHVGVGDMWVLGTCGCWGHFEMVLDSGIVMILLRQGELGLPRASWAARCSNRRRSRNRLEPGFG
jgi:hypothetical protein